MVVVGSNIDEPQCTYYIVCIHRGNRGTVGRHLAVNATVVGSISCRRKEFSFSYCISLSRDACVKIKIHSGRGNLVLGHSVANVPPNF